VGDLEVQGVIISYRSFIISGVIGQTVLFQGFFEGSYGGFVRMYYQRIFQAIAITPITLSEVLWAELFWGATKGAVASLVVAIIGVVTGEFPVTSLIAVLPFCFLASLLFSALGLTTAAFARNIDHLSYPHYLIVSPMFLLCGVFYPVEALPVAVQVIAWILPLTAVNSLFRTITLGLPLQVQAIPIFIVWLVVLVLVSRRSMFRRLVK
jgi:lipooligosaccharide transport system permease protein